MKMSQGSHVLMPRAEEWESVGVKVTMPGLASLESKSIAFLDNGRPNADVVLAEVRHQLEAKFEVRPVVVEKEKYNPRSKWNQPLPREAFDALVAQVNGVVTALGS